MSSPYTAQILADAPIRYYPLNETSGSVAHDATGNFDAALLAPYTLAQPGLIRCDADKSLYLNLGAIDGHTDNPAGTAFSFEFLVQKHGTSMVLIGTGDYYSTLQEWIYIDSSNYLRFDLVPGSTTITSSATVPDDVPVHIVATAVSGGTAHLYMAGADVGSHAVGTFSNIIGNGWYFGIEPSSPSYASFIGYVQDLAIYDHALSSAQVANHYDLSLCPATYVGLWGGA